MSSFLQQHSAYNSGLSSSGKTLRLIGVATVLIGILMLTNWVSIDFSTKLQISFAWILVILSCAYYFMLDIKLAAVATVFLVILTLIIALIAGPVPSFSKFILALIFIAGGGAALYFAGALEKIKATIKGNPLSAVMIPLFFIYDLLEISGFKSVIMK